MNYLTDLKLSTLRNFACNIPSQQVVTINHMPEIANS